MLSLVSLSNLTNRRFILLPETPNIHFPSARAALSNQTGSSTLIELPQNLTCLEKEIRNISLA